MAAPDATLDRRGLLVREDRLRELLGAAYGAFMARLNLTHQPAMGPPRVLVAQRTHLIGGALGTRYVQLPRALAMRQLLANCPPRVALMIVSSRGGEMRLPLQPHQAAVLRHLLADVFGERRQASGDATCLLSMKPGTGKTVLAGALAIALRQRMLFVTFRGHLAKQAVDDLRKYTTLTVSKGVDDGADACVVVINTACALGPDQIARFSLVVFDEVHTYCSRARKDAFWNLNARCVMGMTGTVARSDGFDRLYRWCLGEPIVSEALPGFDFAAAQFRLTVTFVEYHGPRTHTRILTHPSTGKPFMHYMYNQMLDDPARVRVVCDEIRRLHAAGHFTYVFAEDCAHLRTIMLALGDSLGALGAGGTGERAHAIVEDARTVGYFVGTTSSREADRIRAESRVVFTTYGLSATGTSWQHMTAMVLVTPRKSGTRQLAARIMRMGSDPAIVREIVDIVDADVFVRRQRKLRAEAYAEYGAEVSVRQATYRVRRGVCAPPDAEPVIIDV